MSGETTLTIIGNLTADPELRYTQGGLAVANFTVASTPRTFDRQASEWKDGETLFMQCSIWRDPAEHVAGSLTKGQRVIVTGVLKQRTWEDKKTQEKRTGMQLDVEEVGPSLKYATAAVTRAESSSNGSPRGGAAQSTPAAAPGADPWATPGGFNDETPF